MKESAVTTFRRRLRILAMFKRGGRLTAQQIGERLRHSGEEMEERSVQRTLDVLRDAEFVEVAEAGAKPLEWRWRKDQHLVSLPGLSNEEVLAFRMLEHFLKPLLPRETYDQLFPYFTAARDELGKMLPWAPVKNWEAKVRMVPPAQPLLPPEPPPTRQDDTAREQWQHDQRRIRDAILQALFADRQCEIQYRQIWRDEPVRWIVHPLVFLQRGPAFYLLCTLDDYADVRQIALHRIVSAQVLGHAARKPEGFDAAREVERVQGMGGSGESIRLVARFWKRAGLHLLETRLATDQAVVDEDDEHITLSATVADTAQLRWWLLSFGSNVEVLGPEGLRGEMGRHGYWMNRIYANNNEPAEHQR
jgi:predicted DNA-binding transcriptional regulator YafY